MLRVVVVDEQESFRLLRWSWCGGTRGPASAGWDLLLSTLRLLPQRYPTSTIAKLMLQFKYLPSDVVPLVLSHLAKPQDLAATSRVSKIFHSSAVPLLYDEVFIYTWHRDPKAKVLTASDYAREHPNDQLYGICSP